MPRPLGKNQRDLLAMIARPGVALVVPTKVSRPLVRRGLAAHARPDAFVHITPAGLRALAAEAEAGRLKLAPTFPGDSTDG